MIRWLLLAAPLLFAAACTDAGKQNSATIAGRSGIVLAVDGRTATVPRGTLLEDVEAAALGQLVIRDDGFAYTVAVTLECYDLVRVGDPWPSDHDACR